jgi:hypothetical protein
MKNILKKFVCISLCAIIIFSFAGCSGLNNDLTEENVTATVEAVEQALKDFDEEALEKYVDSTTLSYIMNFAKKHDQFAELGKAIFAGLSIEVESIDLDAKTVTVNVSNKDLNYVAGTFAYNLTNKYSTFQLLSKLSDDSFLDSSLSELLDGIADATSNVSATVTLNITQEKKNLVLSFDDDAEDAVSGGALTAIKKITGQ